MATSTLKRVKTRTSPRPQTEISEAYIFPTELGYMLLAWRGDSLLRIGLGHESAASAAAALKELGATATDSPPPFVAKLAGRLQAYAAGADDDFRDVPLDLPHLSRFQKRVIGNCRRIRIGQTLTYGQLAAKSGSPGASRAVGGVMSRNRFPIVIPCHRVVGASGSLGGFSAPQGIRTKERMLLREGALSGRRLTRRKAK